jgi:hypothetical protein
MRRFDLITFMLYGRGNDSHIWVVRIEAVRWSVDRLLHHIAAHLTLLVLLVVAVIDVLIISVIHAAAAALLDDIWLVEVATQPHRSIYVTQRRRPGNRVGDLQSVAFN